MLRVDYVAAVEVRHSLHERAVAAALARRENLQAQKRLGLTLRLVVAAENQPQLKAIVLRDF